MRTVVGSARCSRSAPRKSWKTQRRRRVGSDRDANGDALPRRNGPRYLEPTLDKPRWLFYLRSGQVITWQGQDWAKRYK